MEQEQDSHEEHEFRKIESLKLIWENLIQYTLTALLTTSQGCVCL